MKPINILVLGANGFIGKNLCEFLTGKKHKVIGTLRSERKEIKNYIAIRVPNYSISEIKKVILQYSPNVVINCIGRVNGTDDEIKESNIKVVNNIVQSILQTNPSIKLIQLSSVSAISPTNTYGFSKNESDNIIQNTLNLKWIILRPALIYGKGDNKNVAGLIKMVKAFPIIPVPHSDSIKLQPTYIKDLCEAINKIIESKLSNKTYVISGPEQLSLAEMLKNISEAYKKNPLIIKIPSKTLISTALYLKKMIPLLPIPKQQLETLSHQPFWDHRPLITDFKISLTRFRDGLKEDIEG